jgi:hypothetical protein
MLKLLDMLGAKKNGPQSSYEALGLEEFNKIGAKECLFYKEIELIKKEL